MEPDSEIPNRKPSVDPGGLPVGDQAVHEAEVARLLEEHQFQLRGYVRALLPGVRDISDAFQEVNIAIWNSRNRFQIGTNFKAWAFAVARFVSLNFKKKLQREGWLVFDDEAVYSMKFDFEETDDTGGSRQVALARCLGELSHDELRLLKHHYTSDAPLEIFAARSQRAVGALRVSLHKIRIKLRRCIVRKLQEKPA